ncbi:unnamed protein product [Acanthoscelides obtectus]|uniref:Uncharacterized protein n=1 Tax=Acanthoscelides obtectus TaxID=200917 RepID=A0A9P0MLE6_ACAOB|nr:unnamed protein product [Acanthoscelides obtectus]CAK1629952.1 hypothetical protein AOBTE_LOCUS6061 [Acanthoscelides obtectus]
MNKSIGDWQMHPHLIVSCTTGDKRMGDVVPMLRKIRKVATMQRWLYGSHKSYRREESEVEDGLFGSTARGPVLGYKRKLGHSLLAN